MTSYFETSFEKLNTPKQIENYRNQLYNIRILLVLQITITFIMTSILIKWLNWNKNI